VKCPNCQHENPPESTYCGKCATRIRGQENRGHVPVPEESGTCPPDSSRPNVTETMETPCEELTTGSTFAGRYQVIEELGHGGMGKVYKVFDTKIKEKVALKLIKPEVASDKETIERFSNEIRLARRIGQRNVCKMFDIGEAEGAHFITMEYVHGEDLKSMIEMSGSLSLGMLLSVGKQVCDGLAEAHGLGVVHRDLKPQNIMIDKHGNAKIMDFGIARSVREKGITGPSMMIGTPEYMSPEQAEAKEVDHRSDIYSLGVILYEMATSHVPFTGETSLSIAMKHKGEIPKNPKQLNPSIPDDMSGVILKCLEKDKAKRYQSASEVHSELERIEKGIPTTEKVLPSVPTTSKQITVSFNPRRLVVPGVAVLAVVAAIVVIFSVLPGKKTALRASGKPSLAILYFENISGDKTLDAWKTGLTEMLITKLSQSKFIRILDANTIYGILRRLNLAEAKKYTNDDLVKVANEAGANFTLSGSLMKAGDKIIINLTLQKPQTSEVISPLNVECQNEAEIIQKVDEVATKIKSDLNLSSEQIAGDIDQNIREISTPNAEAWAYYVESRRYHFRREYTKAIPLLQKALSLDPEFVMAVRALDSAYSNIGDWPESRKYAARTLELIEKHPERVSERDRYFIEHNYYTWSRPEQDWGKAIEAGRKLLALYPDDPSGNYSMGVVYGRIEEWDEALKYYETAVNARDRFAATYQETANVHRAKGEPDKAREVLEKYLREVENTASGHQDLAYLHISRNRLDLAGRELETAETLNPSDWHNRRLRGDILLLKGDLAGAEAEYRALLDEKLPMARYYGFIGLFVLLPLEGRYGELKKILFPLAEQSRNAGAGEAEWNGRFFIAYSSWQSGRPGVAVDECQKAYGVNGGRWDSGYKRRTLHLEGFADLGLNRIAEAEKTAEELKALIDKGLNKKAIRLYDHLMGAVELARNNTSKALEYLERAVSALPYGPYEKDAWFIDTLAEAYFRAGDLTKAREQYEKITALTSGRLASYGDIFARSFYHLGQVYDKLEDKIKARESYQKFLDLWKNADADLPEPAEAKKRLAALT
jgi:serine/threonine protein kinase/Flp pilus assembly protein TadD